ncbi:hypothetical protein PFISCL1PPCAC_16199, partial [Pristionchus fissidentatus]
CSVMSPTPYPALISIMLAFIFSTVSAASSKSRHPVCEDVLSLATSTDPVHTLFTAIPKQYSQLIPKRELFIGTEMVHGVVVSEQHDCSKSSSSSSRKNRPLCNSHSILNINRLRIPQTIVETVCTCSSPNNSKFPFLSSHVRCIPDEYLMRVLIFDEKCEKFQSRIETISVGCTAVYENVVTSPRDINIADEEPVTPQT